MNKFKWYLISFTSLNIGTIAAMYGDKYFSKFNKNKNKNQHVHVPIISLDCVLYLAVMIDTVNWFIKNDMLQTLLNIILIDLSKMTLPKHCQHNVN